jgi:alkylation response protein AidB-like acyl-CoA dehydrogenase
VDYELTADQELFAQTTRKFVAAESPMTAVRALEHDPGGFDRGYWRRGAELGWTSVLVDEKDGGGSVSGSGVSDLTLVAEEMGRMVAPGPLVPTNVVAATVSASGTAEQRADLLPGILSGDLVAAWACAERTGSWDASGLALTSIPDGDGFTLTGTKTFVEAGAQADVFLVTARTGTGLSQFVVPASTPGVTVTPRRSLDLVRRFANVDFDHVAVPPSAAVGVIGGAGADVERQLQLAVVLQSAESVGATARAFEVTLEYAADRFSFGRPLASYQALKHRFADSKLWVETCAAAVTAAARAVDDGGTRAAEMASVAKSYVGDSAPEIVQDCVQMHGGIGVTWEHDLHLYLRRVTVNRNIYGTPMEHRERLAMLLGM